MKILKRFILVCLTVFFYNLTFAQVDEYQVYGKVIDGNGKIIPNANIVDKTNKRGTISNVEGVFLLSVKTLPVELIVSHISYKEKVIHITTEESESKFYYFEIVLEKKNTILQEIEITAQEDKRIYKSKHTKPILDYNVSKKGLFLLLSDKKKRILRIVDAENGIWKDKILPFKAQEIIEDCQANIHLKTRDSVYQVLFPTKDSIYFYPAHSLNKYNETIGKCAAYANNSFVFKELSNHNQQIHYWSIVENKKVDVFTVFDENRYLYADDFLIRRQELINRYGDIDEMGEITSMDLSIKRKILQLEFAYKFVGKIPTYNPLFNLNDTLVLFNHVNDSIYFLDKDYKKIKVINIQYHKVKNWGKKIYFDEGSNKFYLKFVRNGLVVLKEFNLYHGKMGKEIKLNDRLFPEKISIFEGEIYYLYLNIQTGIKSLMVRDIK